jgi:ankyrin repeat protein
LTQKVLPFFLHGLKTSSFYAAWAEDTASEYESGYHINELLGLHQGDSLGFRLLSASHSPPTPLSTACAFGFLSLLKEFDHILGSDWNQEASRQCSARNLLYIAVKEGQRQAVPWILRKGIDPTLKDINGQTPLSEAAGSGREAVVKLLVERDDVEADSKDYDGRTPLICGFATHSKRLVMMITEGPELEIVMHEFLGFESQIFPFE